MKSDQKNIDDLFKEALGDFTEQPSAGVWKHISGKLFWNDLAHFRFGNIPRVWVGVAAAGLILTTLFFVYPSPDQNTVINTEQAEVTEKVTNENNEDDLTKIESSNSNDAFIISPDGHNDLIHQQTLPQKLAEIVATDNPVILSQPDNNEIPELGEVVSQKPNNYSTKDEAINTANDVDPTQVVAENTGTNGTVSTFSEIPETSPAIDESVQNTAEANLVEEYPSQPVIVEEVFSDGTESIEARLLTVKDDISAGETLESKAVQSIQKVAPTAGTLEEIQNSELQTLFLTDREFSDESVNSAGKIQKIHSLSFSMGQLFKGKYKPPKRTFQEPGMSLYRGYQPYFSISAYLAPEATYYTRMASQSRENSYTGGVAVSYNSSKYIIQSGLELNFSDDLGDYMVNMDTYDSIGYYNEVTGFEIDPNNPDSVILHIEEVAIWDSVSHHSHQQTQNSYTYLQIPIMFGYKAMESGRFSAHIKAGPSFSFLLNRREPALDFQMPGATIKTIENYTAPRLNTCIQIVVSLALQFHFTENFGILVEPTYRYYLNSVYDVNDESLKNPYGVGVRGGLFYNF